jgi:hypothetical protein
MKTVAVSLIVPLVAFGLPLAHAEQQFDWLIGTWTGDVQGIPEGRNPSRTLMVKAIKPDGVVDDGYFFVTGGQLSPAQITVNGSQVKVITRVKSVAELSRLSDDRLAGSLNSPNGTTFPITLTKVSTRASLANRNRDFDPQSLVGEWVGSWTKAGMIGAGGPSGGPYRMTIRRVEGSRVFGHLDFSVKQTVDLDFVGTLDGNRLTYGRTQLTIYGGDNLMQMRGASLGGTPEALGNKIGLDIVLNKKK